MGLYREKNKNVRDGLEFLSRVKGVRMSIQVGKPLALTRGNNLRESLFVSAIQDAWTIPLWGYPEHAF